MLVPPIPQEIVSVVREMSDKLKKNKQPSLLIEGGVLDGLLFPEPPDWDDGEAFAIDMESLVTGVQTPDFVFVRMGRRLVFDAETTAMLWVNSMGMN